MIKQNANLTRDLLCATTGQDPSAAMLAWAEAEMADTHSYQLACEHYKNCTTEELEIVADLLGLVPPSGERCPLPVLLRERYLRGSTMVAELIGEM